MLSVERLLAPCREAAGLLIERGGARCDVKVRPLLQLSNLVIDCGELAGQGVRVKLGLL